MGKGGKLPGQRAQLAVELARAQQIQPAYAGGCNVQGVVVAKILGVYQLTNLRYFLGCGVHHGTL